LALGLFTVGLPDGTKAYVLAAIEHATRRIRILGATAHPGGQWIVQQARNLCMDLDQAGANVKFVLHDRDATFHEGFDPGIHRGRPADRAQRRPDAPDELDHGAVDRRMPPRASRPHPYLEPAPPPHDPAGLRACTCAGLRLVPAALPGGRRDSCPYRARTDFWARVKKGPENRIYLVSG
jgi:hypothetical protein